MMLGPCPLWIKRRSSPSVTSVIEWRPFSICPCPRTSASREAEGGKHSGGLPLPPLGDGEEGEMVGKQGGDGASEDGSKGEAPGVRAAGIGNMRKRGEQRDGRKGRD